MNDALPIELDAPPMRDERLIEIERLLTLAKFNDDEIKRFAEVVLDDHIEELTDRVKDGETECRHLREALASSNDERIKEMNTRIIKQEEVEKLRMDMRLLNTKLSEQADHALGSRVRVKELESQLANKQVPSPELDGIADYLAGIRPDKNCRTPGCYGMRGYSGFTTDIDVKTGHRKITVNLCCGKVGETEYARILKKLEAIDHANQSMYVSTTKNISIITSHQLFVMIHGWWLIVKAKMKRKPATEATDVKA